MYDCIHVVPQEPKSTAFLRVRTPVFNDNGGVQLGNRETAPELDSGRTSTVSKGGPTVWHHLRSGLIPPSLMSQWCALEVEPLQNTEAWH